MASPAMRLLVISLGLAGCTPDPLPPPGADMGVALLDPQIDPRTIFQSQALPAMASCITCHKAQQGDIKPFLTAGSEYDAITTYGMGKFLSANPSQSLLLTKMAHTGPALNADQETSVLSWLTVEAGARSKLTGGAQVTPSVALRQGDFFINLEKLVGDPLASITFHVEPGGPGSFHLTKMLLSAGPGGGVHMLHPVFMLFSVGTAYKDPGDSLSEVDMKVPTKTSQTIGAGSIILTNVPLGARTALAFETIEPTNPVVGGVLCKALALFKTNVQPILRSPCATTCHSAMGSDARAPQATSAFDMSQATAMDDATLQQLCVRTLGRCNVQNPAQSVLVLQPQPVSSGGTANHPFKWSSDAVAKSFADSVGQWLSAEK